MKKFLTVAAVALLSLAINSCKQEPVEVSGVVTYFFNKHQGYKPDIGAKVYLVTRNTDTLADALLIIQSQELIKSTQQTIDSQEEFKGTEYYSEDMIKGGKDAIAAMQEANKKILEKYKLTEEELIDKAYTQKLDIISSSKNITGAVDATGRYSIKAPKGKYSLVIASEGREGKMHIEKIEIGKTPIQKDAKFEI